MREDFLIERHGKKYALFAGLLDEAHARGLHSIDTLLVQVPKKDNGDVAVVFAKATMDTDAEPSQRRYFTGIGDASPENVGKNIAPHLIRMAETRAKARALRDAINVRVTAFEELGGDEPVAPQSGQLAVATQKTRIVDLVHMLGSDLNRFEAKHGPLAELTYGEAAKFIADAENYLSEKAGT